MQGCGLKKLPLLPLVCLLHYRPSRLSENKSAAIQRTGLFLERDPNESLGLGSSGQQAGGSEMKQTKEERKKKNSMAGRRRHIWAELEKVIQPVPEKCLRIWEADLLSLGAAG